MLTTLTVAMLATTAPPPRHGLDALLAKPVSPGLIALLMPYIADDRAAGRVIESLSHAEAPVRAAAARVASMAKLASAGAPVRRALEAETDRSAAAEQMRAALVLAPPGDELSLVPAARKHELIGLLAELLAGIRGPVAIPLLDRLREAGLSETREHDFIASATRRGQQGLNVVAVAAVRTGNVGRWSTVLSLARQPRAVFSPGLLTAALGSPKAELRAATYWHLALMLAQGGAPSSDMEAAIAGTPEVASPETANVDAAFALVVFRRAFEGARFGGDWGARAAAGNPVVPLDLSGRPEAIRRFLTKAEARALSRRLTSGESDKMFETEKNVPGKAGAEIEAGPQRLWIAGGLPPGMLRDILSVTGCVPAPGLRATGLVVYWPDGRPRQVSVADDFLSGECAEVDGPVLALSLFPALMLDLTQAESRNVVIPLDAAAVECADQPEPSEVLRVRDDSLRPDSIDIPRKVKNVSPQYPEGALAARRQGTVIIEAIISESGCIGTFRVVRAVATDLEAAAITAIRQWRYAPATLNGKPVAVLLTLVVHFSVSVR